MTRERTLRTVIVLAVGLILLATAGYFRLYRLGEIPSGLFLDEGANGLDALRVLDGQIAPFYPTNNGREGLLILLIAPFVAWLGQTALALRLPSALAGVAAVLVVFALGQVLFARHRWRGVAVGALAAAFMITSLTQTILGRIAFRSNLLLLLLPLAVLGVWLGWRRRSWGWMALGAVATGLAVYTYIPARLLPVFWLMAAATLILTQRPSRAEIRQRLPLLALYVGLSGLVALPLLVHFALNPADFSSRSGDLWIFAQGDALGLLVRNLLDHLAVFGVHGDVNWRHNLPGRPLLVGVEALFFWIGVVTSLVQWRQPARQLLLIWLGVFLLPAVLSLDFAPNTLRMTAMMPAVFLVTALGAVDSASWLLRFTGHFRRSATAGLVLTAVIFLGWRAADSARLYFDTWATAAPVLENFDVSKWLRLKSDIEANPRQDTVYIATFDNRHPIGYRPYNFDFLYQGRAPVHIFRSMDDDFAAQLGQALAAAPGTPHVAAVEWTNDPYADATGRLPFLLGKYGHFVETEERDGYRLHHFDNLHTDTAWTIYPTAEQNATRFDNGLVLRAAALRGPADMPLLEDACPLLAGAELWAALRWRAESAPQADYRVSLRLHNADGAVVHQAEAPVLGFDYSGTAAWQPGHEGESLLHIALPAELPPGPYEVRLVVYDQVTLTPAVVVDVWTPEVTVGCLTK